MTGVNDIFEKVMGRALALALVSLVIFTLGCSREDRAGARKDPGPHRVVAVGSQWYGHIPVWVGMERGIFEKAGFDVRWRFIGKSMDRLNAISSGEAQFASLGEIAMLSAMAQGNRRFYWVGNQDIAPGFEGLVARPGITGFEGLRGGKVGFPFGSSVDITGRLLLAEHGLDTKTDVKLVNLEVGDVPAVFRAGNVDAALVWEPGFSQLKEVPGATVLAMDVDTEIYKRFGTMTGPDVLIINRRWVDEDPGRASRFMEAYFEALEWVRENPDGAVEIAAGRYIRQDPGLLRKNMRKFVWHGAADQRRVMSDSGLFGQAEYVVDILHGDIKAIPVKPAFREWVNLDILPAGG
ncbi:MAG: ABC transporter substrate-binding protein [Thermodesulfobacteriota bacterium]